MARTLVFDHALLPSGWARNVHVTIADGMVTGIGLEKIPGAERIAGIALPGLANVHSHAFQRAMAGLAERRGPTDDTFWTWREVMYRFLGVLTPDDVEAIAAFAYMEMLQAGFTAVGEFHYLHHDVDGRPFADLGEMAGSIAAAAAVTGIGLTLLPSFYAYGGFGAAEPANGQRRFLNDPENFARLVERTRAIIGKLSHGQVGIAPHSLRAVTPSTLRAMMAAQPGGPIHIHAAEQRREVDECMATLGARPVQWLLENFALDQRWCLIHCTHMTAEETRRLAASGAAAGLCPTTEANLGDGIFNAQAFLAEGGTWGVGTDSNIQIDAAAELRQLEYSQRLQHRSRNVLARYEGESTGHRLYTAALAGGAQALRQPIGAIEPGRRADIVTLDADHPDLTGDSGHCLDAYVFVAGPRLIQTVIAGGEIVVEGGRHRHHETITAAYRRSLARLLEN
ncbi:MAG: formimidoylglutamate deiminase [Xanthobacteraceae bacterium]